MKLCPFRISVSLKLQCGDVAFSPRTPFYTGQVSLNVHVITVGAVTIKQGTQDTKTGFPGGVLSLWRMEQVAELYQELTTAGWAGC